MAASLLTAEDVVLCKKPAAYTLSALHFELLQSCTIATQNKVRQKYQLWPHSVLTLDVSPAQVVQDYNADPDVHGILVQLPLPKHINEQTILDAVSFEKDVDGFHPQNIGCLAMRTRDPLFICCTPKVWLCRALKCLVDMLDSAVTCPFQPIHKVASPLLQIVKFVNSSNSIFMLSVAIIVLKACCVLAGLHRTAGAVQCFHQRQISLCGGAQQHCRHTSRHASTAA